LPYRKRYARNRVQYVHIDDMARLIAHILEREPESKRLSILNVAGRGEALTIERCIELSGSKVIRVPGEWACKVALEYAWRTGLSAIPPGLAPYMLGECIMNTDRLRSFLGHDYEHVMRYTIEEAFVESLGALAQVPTVWNRVSNPA
jgi:hypothetical protein